MVHLSLLIMGVDKGLISSMNKVYRINLLVWGFNLWMPDSSIYVVWRFSVKIDQNIFIVLVDRISVVKRLLVVIEI